MNSRRGGRLLTVSALVVVTTLGGVYALGRSLGDNRADTGAGTVPADHRSPAGSAERTRSGGVTDSGRADRPGTGPASSAAPSGEQSGQPGTGAPRQPGVPGADLLDETTWTGPYGSRQTTGSSDVALTFDDGPDPRYTPQVLALLRQYQVKATFCVVGENARDFPDLVRAIVADGHTLCNHSWAHDTALGNRSDAVILADLTRTNDAIRVAVPDARIPYFRQPGGFWKSSVIAVASQLGQLPLHWAVDPRDWTRPPPGTIATSVARTTFPGAIVLLHDGGGDRQNTVAALTVLLPTLIARYRLVSLTSADPSDQTPARAMAPQPGSS